MSDIVYEDVDPESGEPLAAIGSKMMKKALEPDTPLQAQLLAVSKAKRWANTTHRAQWRRLEAKAGASEEGRLQQAWLEHCIDWGVKKNKGMIGAKMPYTGVIAYAQNEIHEQNWKQANREKVLKKKSAEEMKSLLVKAEKASEVYSLDEE